MQISQILGTYTTKSTLTSKKKNNHHQTTLVEVVAHFAPHIAAGKSNQQSTPNQRSNINNPLKVARSEIARKANKVHNGKQENKRNRRGK